MVATSMVEKTNTPPIHMIKMKGVSDNDSSEFGTELSIQAVKLECNAGALLDPFKTTVDAGKVVAAARRYIPGKLERINSFLTFPLGGPMPLSASENIDLGFILDQLGVDFIISYHGKKYAIDVTTAKNFGVGQKVKKFNQMKPFLSAIGGFTPLIIRSVDGELPADLLTRLAKGTTDYNGVDVLYVPMTYHFKRKGRKH